MRPLRRKQLLFALTHSSQLMCWHTYGCSPATAMLFLSWLPVSTTRRKVFEVFGYIVEYWWLYEFRRREEGLMAQQKGRTDHRGYSNHFICTVLKIWMVLLLFKILPDNYRKKKKNEAERSESIAGGKKKKTKNRMVRSRDRVGMVSSLLVLVPQCREEK